MRILFAGTPQVAVPSLDALLTSEHEIVRVITRPDAPLGRKRVLTPSPVAERAAAAEIPMLKTARLDEGATEVLSTDEADLGVIVAFGGLVREPLLSTPRLGWINLHFSLLPSWRGAAPVQRSLMAGDAVTGASVFQLVAALDAGDVFAEQSYTVPPEATAGDVLTALSLTGAELLLGVVDALATGTAQAAPQIGEPSHAAKLELEDGRLLWDETAVRCYDRFRGVTPEPGAFTTINGERLKVLDAALRADEQMDVGEIRGTEGGVLIGAAQGALLVSRLQPAGKGAMSAADWWRGRRDESMRAGS